MFSISTQYLIEEAKRRNYKIDIIDEETNLLYIENGGKKILFKNIDGGVNSSLGYKLADNKNLTYLLLEYHNLPYPKSIKIQKGSNYDIESMINALGFPLVVKPTDTNHGDGISVSITSREELDKAISYAFTFGKEIVIQKFLEGFDHRILVVGEKVVAGIQRKPAFIVGNGINTIKELIEKENNNPLRGIKKSFGNTEVYEKPLLKINVDNIVTDYLLKYYNYTIDNIPGNGEEILLRGNSNISTGGTYTDITDNICKGIKDLCIKLSKIVQLPVVGIDIITTDISKPLVNNNGGIIEINATPGIDMHDNGLMGPSRNVCGKILDLYFIQGKDYGSLVTTKTMTFSGNQDLTAMMD